MDTQRSGQKTRSRTFHLSIMGGGEKQHTTKWGMGIDQKKKNHIRNNLSSASYKGAVEGWATG